MNIVKSLILSTSLLGQLAFADATKEIQFTGQTGENFDLAKTQMVTRYRTEQQNSTCTRSIPYEEEVCGYQTHYRQECHWDPGNETCSTHYEQECHTETTYERECRTTTRYEEECHQGPMRQECHYEPGRQQCRTLPNGEQRCREVPGRQICDKIPGEEICRSVPRSEQECSSTPRYNEVCESVPRESCSGTPGHDVCESVPYEEYECNNETRYRTEEYACVKDIQVPYEVKQKVSSSVEVLFEAVDPDLKELILEFGLLENGKVSIKALKDADQNILIVKKEKVEVEEVDGDLVSKAHFDLKLFDKKAALKPIQQELKVTSLTPFWLSFIVGKEGAFKTEMKLKISKGKKVLLSKTLEEADMVISEQAYGNFVSVKIKELGVELQSGDKPSVEIKVKMEVPKENNLGDLKLSQKKEFDDLTVE